jgi:hypothetical protein
MSDLSDQFVGGKQFLSSHTALESYTLPNMRLNRFPPITGATHIQPKFYTNQ